MQEDYKGFKIVSDGTFGYVNIKALGRGSVPESLRGDYTKTSFAKKAIDIHKEIEEQKRVKSKGKKGS